MKEDNIKKDIDKAETELRSLFDDLIYEHCDNDGQYELNNLTSGFNTLLKYARKWQEAQESVPAAPEATGGSETAEGSILTEAEKEYLSSVIKPFRGKSSITIGKYSDAYGIGEEYIIIWLSTDNPNIKETITFPCFKAGEMYKGMEVDVDKEYTLEELGL